MRFRFFIIPIKTGKRLLQYEIHVLLVLRQNKMEYFCV